MYLGVVHISLSRKEHECVSCKEAINEGEQKFMVVRRFTKRDKTEGKTSRYVHLECFPSYALYAQKLREAYLIASGRVGSGRPQGSELQELIADRPDLAKERLHLLQRRSRLHKKLLEKANEPGSMAWEMGIKSPLEEAHRVEARRPITQEIEDVERRIRAILPLMIDRPGRRSEEKRAELKELREARVVRREDARAAREAVPDPSTRTIEEIDQDVKESLARAEAYQESGQIGREDSRD